MSIYFRPYEGRKPYLFISYSHQDSVKVLDIITLLHNANVRLWYDEGIPAGSDWPMNIETHMKNCAAVLFFASKDAYASPNCFSELVTAKKLAKPVLTLSLDHSERPEKWQPVLAQEKAAALRDTPEDTAAEIRRSGILTRAFYSGRADSASGKAAGLILAVILLAAGADLLYAAASGKLSGGQQENPGSADTRPSVTPTPAPTAEPEPEEEVDLTKYGDFFTAYITFPDVKQEEAIRNILRTDEEKIKKERLAEVTELYFVGNMALDGLESVSFVPEKGYAVTGAPVKTGPVNDLSLIGDCPYLVSLALIDQSAGSLKELSGLVLLKELYLCGCEEADLTGLTDLPGLETLHLEHSGIRDLTPLAAFKRLKTVTVSTDMLPLALNADADFDILLVP